MLAFCPHCFGWWIWDWTFSAEGALTFLYFAAALDVLDQPHSILNDLVRQIPQGGRMLLSKFPAPRHWTTPCKSTLLVFSYLHPCLLALISAMTSAFMAAACLPIRFIHACCCTLCWLGIKEYQQRGRQGAWCCTGFTDSMRGLPDLLFTWKGMIVTLSATTSSLHLYWSLTAEKKAYRWRRRLVRLFSHRYRVWNSMTTQTPVQLLWLHTNMPPYQWAGRLQDRIHLCLRPYSCEINHYPYFFTFIHISG